MTEQAPLTGAAGLPLPPAFLERMSRILGDDYPAFCASYRKPPHPSLRIHPQKHAAVPSDTLLSHLDVAVPWQKYGFYCNTTDDDGFRPGKHPFHEAGLYYIQEASAMLPASLCPPQPGERVLDLCAAPGGKATQLAASLNGDGLLIANEIHPTRAAVLSRNIERMGVRNAVVTNEAPDALAARFPAFFDKIVVDAPCSGEGMFRKEADAVSMWTPELVAMCAARQTDILDKAAQMLSPGGYLTYSTCTFAPEENEGVIMDFLLRHPDFHVVASVEPEVVAARNAGILDGGHPEWVIDGERYPAPIHEAARLTYRVLPHHADGEGHFAALLYKRCDGDVPAHGTGKAAKHGKAAKAPKPSVADTRAYALFSEFCGTVYGNVPSTWGELVPCLFGERLYLLPSALGATSTAVRESLQGLHILRAGLCVGTVVGLSSPRPRFEPDHALAMASEPTELCRCFRVESVADLPPDEVAVAYLRGETLSAPGQRGYCLVTYRGLPLGWGKASDGVLKNHYPKGLRWN